MRPRPPYRPLKQYSTTDETKKVWVPLLGSRDRPRGEPGTHPGGIGDWPREFQSQRRISGAGSGLPAAGPGAPRRIPKNCLVPSAYVPYVCEARSTDDRFAVDDFVASFLQLGNRKLETTNWFFPDYTKTRRSQDRCVAATRQGQTGIAEWRWGAERHLGQVIRLRSGARTKRTRV